MHKSDENWLIREAHPADISFIYSSWLKSFKHDSKLGKSMRSGVFFSYYREVIDNILENSIVYIACLPDDTSVILGYLVTESALSCIMQPGLDARIHHYCFVKQSFRRLGIAMSLFKHAKGSLEKDIYTHSTGFTSDFSILKELTYNPLILYKV